MKLVVSRRATRRLREIAAYIHDRNPRAAIGVQRAIEDAFELLATYPEAGRAIEHGVRLFAVPRLPYLIYCKVDETVDEVVMITVRHAARWRPA